MVRVVLVKSVFRVYVELVFPFLKLSGVPSSWGGCAGSCHGWVRWWFVVTDLSRRARSVEVVGILGLLGSGIFRSLLAATKSAPFFGLGGKFRVGCNRGESVRFCFFVCVLLVRFEWSSMAIRWFPVCSASLSLLPPLASCSDSPTV